MQFNRIGGQSISSRKQPAEIQGYVVVCIHQDGEAFISARIYHCEELAEQEAIRQRGNFAGAIVDRLSLNVERAKDGRLNCYCPTLDETGVTVEEHLAK